ncbi:YaiI/YqxD family protein [Niallia sp. Sow4_A1]|uniref:YaiI/YqxD family protein n=1 Tax=Bacillaceae TaxID=186817 RepID=UPI0004E224BC|nr:MULTISPECIES: YaiI/YqxD family protein [Bacillaceae]MCM3360854.1 YaiI/YqxD family protein [Niallia sp. MER TA 168]
MVYVDADSCPVKEDIVEIASYYHYELLFVASYAHMMKENDEQKWKYVDSDKEAVDLFIMNATKKQDIVVTQDIGLASTLLLKQVTVLSPRGVIFEEKTINTALDMRYLSAKARRKGVYGKGPKPYTEEDRQKFRRNFIRILSKVEGESIGYVE